jgi:hypothetical protein
VTNQYIGNTGLSSKEKVKVVMDMILFVGALLIINIKKMNQIINVKKDSNLVSRNMVKRRQNPKP